MYYILMSGLIIILTGFASNLMTSSCHPSGIKVLLSFCLVMISFELIQAVIEQCDKDIKKNRRERERNKWRIKEIDCISGVSLLQRKTFCFYWRTVGTGFKYEINNKLQHIYEQIDKECKDENI